MESTTVYIYITGRIIYVFRTRPTCVNDCKEHHLKLPSDTMSGLRESLEEAYPNLTLIVK